MSVISRGDGGLVTKLCLTLMIPWTVACQASLHMELPRQEYGNGLPFPSPGDLPDPGIKSGTSELQAVSCNAGRSFTNWATREVRPDLYTVGMIWNFNLYYTILSGIITNIWIAYCYLPMFFLTIIPTIIFMLHRVTSISSASLFKMWPKNACSE